MSDFIMLVGALVITVSGLLLLAWEPGPSQFFKTNSKKRNIMDPKTLEYMSKRVDAARKLTERLDTLNRELTAFRTGPVYLRVEYKAYRNNHATPNESHIPMGELRAFCEDRLTTIIAETQSELDAL